MELLTLLPAIIALVLAVWKKDVIVALVAALISSELIMASGNVLTALTTSIERTVLVFTEPSNTRVMMFALLIGGLMALIRSGGGVSGFVAWISSTPVANSPRRVGLLSMFTGIIIFIESNLSLLTSGVISRDLFDRFKLSRARLAFIIDSTCAPVSVLILLNAWGAFLLTLIEPYAPGQSVSILLGSIVYNFYPIIILMIVLYTVLSGRVYGPMKDHETEHTSIIAEQPVAPKHPLYFILPIVTMVLSIVAFMFVTGDGDILQGSGSTSVLWGTILGLMLAYLMNKYGQKTSHKTLMNTIYLGMSELMPVVVTVLLAIALGASMRSLGTGDFVSGLVADNLLYFLIAPVTFIAAAIIAFTTGTSWGTFSLLTPIAMPIALATGIDPSLLMAAVIGGGVFGDHCSPISDTTIVASLASGVDHLTHVKTQLPYALVAGVVSIVAYIVVSL